MEMKLGHQLAPRLLLLCVRVLVLQFGLVLRQWAQRVPTAEAHVSFRACVFYARQLQRIDICQVRRYGLLKALVSWLDSLGIQVSRAHHRDTSIAQ